MKMLGTEIHPRVSYFRARGGMRHGNPWEPPTSINQESLRAVR